MTEVLRACLMGHRIGYSRSPRLHGYWLRSLGLAGTYELADVQPEDFAAFFRDLRGRGFVGGNVTKPHKEAAFRLVDRRDAAAEAIGAVNTVWVENGALIGSNTDAPGFLASLDDGAPGWDRGCGLAVILGAGGAARALVHALLCRGLCVAVVNRTRARADDLASHFGSRVRAHGPDELAILLQRAQLLTNAASLGGQGQPPLDLDLAPLNDAAVVCDINYVPLDTALLRAARARGLRTVDGLGMLMHQAVPAFARWFGVTPQVTPELRALLTADIAATIRAA
jgi:shikimate dehydrogenase